MGFPRRNVSAFDTLANRQAGEPAPSSGPPPGVVTAVNQPSPQVQDNTSERPGQDASQEELLKAQLDIADRYLEIYNRAIEQAQQAFGERRKELEQVANTASAEIDSIYRETLPQLEAHAAQVKAIDMDAGGRAERLRQAGQQTASYNAAAGHRELDFQEKQAVQGLTQQRDLAMLGLEQQQLNQQLQGGSGAGLNSFIITGTAMSRYGTTDLTPEQQQELATEFAQAYGISQEEAIGRVMSATGDQAPGFTDAASVATASAQGMVDRNFRAFEEGKKKIHPPDRAKAIKELRRDFKANGLGRVEDWINIEEWWQELLVNWEKRQEELSRQRRPAGVTGAPGSNDFGTAARNIGGGPAAGLIPGV